MSTILKASTAQRLNPRYWTSEQWGIAVLRLFAAMGTVTLLSIVLILVTEAIPFFEKVPASEFFFTKDWTALFEPKHFGVLPLLCGTLLVAMLACLIALPLGVLAALYLVEYATGNMRGVLKPIVELMAGIPSVVFGYIALTSVTPLLRSFFPAIQAFNALSASLAVAAMVLPLIISLSAEAMQAVPKEMKNGVYALGATKFEVICKVVLPQSLSTIFSAFILAFSRATGETMAVTLAAGANPRLTLNPLESIQTMTAYIVQVSTGDAPHGTIEYQSLFAIGLLLFVLTFVTNLIARVWLYFLQRKFQVT